MSEQPYTEAQRTKWPLERLRGWRNKLRKLSQGSTLRPQRQGFYSLTEPVEKPQVEQLTFLRLDLGCFWVSGLR
jgi:hypothetical protein